MTNPTILVVDDDPLILKFVSANLRARDFDVIAAEDGESALKFFTERKLDLVILDIMLPGTDGLEVCQQIRKSSEVPIIMLSAKNDLTDKIELLNLGADDYLTKPFAIDELLARVAAVMRSQQQETSLR
ncbi:MAG: response regulator [Chloroflexi bacterium]|nr:response regulator [Chloroflexota bacterium]